MWPIYWYQRNSKIWYYQKSHRIWQIQKVTYDIREYEDEGAREKNVKICQDTTGIDQCTYKLDNSRDLVYWTIQWVIMDTHRSKYYYSNTITESQNSGCITNHTYHIDNSVNANS